MYVVFPQTADRTESRSKEGCRIGWGAVGEYILYE
jgi:hypothetical protein